MPVAGTSVHPHHDTGGLDDRIRTLAYLKAQAFGGTFGGLFTGFSGRVSVA